ncbi:FMN-dependent NADH-azoreductase [Dinghuibacter silviterrae]|uniref:FMN dependent NADH:quinone oxidoreductase n=1 Tax=Dinghuibacter silviterrae TaxID=1539049 RepID=A0A4R8DHN3_9BACT|nr:NAD(P)H-dependent oxidoreductase [Dinghuibacter silviterrae]TDW97045.1 FMN-dependent NADH-azoreductase [Dinghuibacter silviterrae]
MKKILHVISSPRSGESVSLKLGNAIIDKLLTAYPGSTVTTKDLRHLPHVNEKHIAAFFTPADAWTPENEEAIRYSNEAIQAIWDADILVIGAPMYNFSIPSSLKAWLDQIVRVGVTFKPGATGIEGLITGKKVYLAVASGWVYSEGPMKEYDFVVPYLQRILSTIGMNDITVIRAEGVNRPETKVGAFERAVDSIVL